MIWVFILLLFVATIPGCAIYYTSDRVHVFVRGMFGAEIIYVRRWDGLYWKAVLHRDPWGELFAYRYPATRIGFVSLNADGTGCYTGEVKWLRASEVKRP